MALGVVSSCSATVFAQDTDFDVSLTLISNGFQVDETFSILFSGAQVGVDTNLDCVVDIDIPIGLPDYLGAYNDPEHYVLELDNDPVLKPYYMGTELTTAPSCQWRLSYYTMENGQLDAIYSTIMFGSIGSTSPGGATLIVQDGLEWPVSGDADGLLGFGPNAHTAVSLADFDSLTFSVSKSGYSLAANVNPPSSQSTDFDVAISSVDVSSVNTTFSLDDVFSLLFSGAAAYVDTNLDCEPNVEIPLGFADDLGEYLDPEHYVLEFADAAPAPPYFLGSELTPVYNRGWRLSYYTRSGGELDSIVSTILSGSYAELPNNTTRLYVADALEWPVSGDAEGLLGFGPNAHVAAELADFRTFIVDGSTMRAEVDDVCIADLNNNGIVDGADLALVLGNWGECQSTGPCIGDITGNGLVDGADVTFVLTEWGNCAK